MAQLSDLLEAVKANDVDAVERLLSADPRLLSARTDSGLSPVLMATYARAGEVLTRLLERGPKLDVYEAAALGRAELVRERIQERPELVSALGADGWTPTHLAAFFGHLDTCRVLLEAGADLAAISANPIHNTPLHAAIAGSGDLRVIDALLEAGAPLEAVAGGGFTPLHVAASRGDRQLVDRLVARGASPLAENDEGKSPADIADEYDHPKTAEHLRDLAS